MTIKASAWGNYTIPLGGLGGGGGGRATLLETSGREEAVLTRHGVSVKVISDGLLQLVVGRGLLEALAQVVLQVLVQFASCRQTKRHIESNQQQMG